MTDKDLPDHDEDEVIATNEQPKKRQRRQATAHEIVQRANQTTPKRVKIILEENEAIPPTGLPLQHNGRAIVIMPGEIVEVPEHYIEILDHAVMSTPTVDPQTKQVLGYRDRLRYPYRRV